MYNFNRNKIKAIVKVISQLVRCPRCSGSFGEHDVEMVAGMGMTYFVRLNCSHCRLGVMASLVQTDQAGSVPVTKTSYQDFTGEPIDSNDLIDLHDFMKDFRGDFRSLLRK